MIFRDVFCWWYCEPARVQGLDSHIAFQVHAEVTHEGVVPGLENALTFDIQLRCNDASWAFRRDSWWLIYIYMAISVNFMASWLSSQVCYVLLRVNYYYIQSLTHEAWNVLAPPCQPMQTVGSSPFAWWAVRTDKLEFDGIRRRDHW